MSKIIDLLGLSEFKKKIISLIPTKTSQLQNDSITPTSIGAATAEIVGASKSILGSTNIKYHFPINGSASVCNSESDLNTALLNSTKKITDEVIKIEEKFESFETAKSKIVSSAFGEKLGLTNESKMEDVATAIDEANVGILWKNTANGTYKFIQNGNRWVANNRGINSSTATSTWVITVLEPTTAYIGYRVATETNYDKLTITLNGTTVVNAISGLNSYELSTALNLVEGINTIVASYAKDSSNSHYGDMAYIVLPPLGEQPGQYDYDFKSITPTGSVQTIYPDTGFDGLSHVTVEAMKLQSKSVDPTNSTQKIQPDEGYDALSAVVVRPKELKLQSKTVELSTSSQIIRPDSGYEGLTMVSIPAMKLQSKSITPTGSVQTIYPDTGFDGLSAVSVAAVRNFKSGTFTTASQNSTKILDIGFAPSQLFLTSDVLFVNFDLNKTGTKEIRGQVTSSSSTHYDVGDTKAMLQAVGSSTVIKSVASNVSNKSFNWYAIG